MRQLAECAACMYFRVLPPPPLFPSLCLFPSLATISSIIDRSMKFLSILRKPILAMARREKSHGYRDSPQMGESLATAFTSN